MKISIIGAGRVGSTIAHTLLCRGVSEDLVIVNRNRALAEGEALDMMHAKSFLNQQMNVRAGDVSDTSDSDVIVLTCSAPWNKNYKSRFDMGIENLRIFKELVPQLAEASPNAKILVITNPVDVMTYHAIMLSGFGASRVFGTGTLIDSARFRTALSAKIGIHPDDVRAYVLGEHGDSQFPFFSIAVVGGTRIIDDKDTRDIFAQTICSGYDVMNLKGHTNFAIGMAASLVIEAIAWNTLRTMPLSVLVPNTCGISDVCLSLPVVVGKEGIVRILEPDFGAHEVESFSRCAQIVRSGIAQSLG